MCMMDGIQSMLKFLLIFFNFIIFVVGVVVFGIAVWVIVDAPKFTELFDKTKEVVSPEVDTSALELNIYTSVLYAFLVIAGFFIVVAFFGCCGAWKENKCLLGIYFLVVLTLLIGVIVFGILVYKGDLFDRLEAPLFKSLNMYEDNPAGNEAEKTKKEAFKQIWNTVQQDMKCCGVLNADDWRTNVTNPDWSPATFNKPLGCCNWKKDDKGMDTDISKISTEVDTCRSALYTTDSEKVYHFEGCLSKFRSEITENKEMVIWIAIAALLALVATLLVTMAMCMTIGV